MNEICRIYKNMLKNEGDTSFKCSLIFSAHGHVYVYAYVCFISIWRNIALYRYIV